MPLGIFICSGSLLIGAIFGASLNRFIPEHLKKNLTANRWINIHQYGRIFSQ